MALFYTPTTSVNLNALISKYLPDFANEELAISLVGSTIRSYFSESLPAELQLGCGHIARGSQLSPYQEVIVFDPSRKILYQQNGLVIVPENAVKISLQVAPNGLPACHSRQKAFFHGDYVSIFWGKNYSRLADLSMEEKLSKILDRSPGKFSFDLVLMGDTYITGQEHPSSGLISYQEAGNQHAHPETILLSYINDLLVDSSKSGSDIKFEEFGWTQKKHISLFEIEASAVKQLSFITKAELPAKQINPGLSQVAISAKLKAEIENEDVNLQDENGNTLLHRKAREGKASDVRELLTAGSAISIKNKDGNTPLHEAVIQNQLTTAAILIDNGADVNARNYLHNTPLHYAAEMDLNEIVFLLIGKKADIELQNKEGYSPLHVSAQKGSYQAALALIENNAAIEARSKGGLTTLHLAASHGQAELCQLLLDKGAELNALTEGKESALHLAASHGHVKLIKLLINNQADVSITNSKGETYLQCISYA